MSDYFYEAQIKSLPKLPLKYTPRPLQVVDRRSKSLVSARELLCKGPWTWDEMEPYLQACGLGRLHPRREEVAVRP